ncbi:Protein SDPN-1 a [Aphelenchoides avenae]|nr:Protein SDPN-1 a [Aphelenchus avenae]
MSITNLTVQPAFWEVGGYKSNVRRIKDGSEQLDEFTRMIKERMEIETKYGKHLQLWQQKWAAYVDRQVPPSNVKSCWNNVLDEGKALSQAHLAVKDRLNDEIVKTVGLFKKENYHTSAIRGFKEVKDIDEEFEKAQRQWKKLLEKVEIAKKAYHSACRAEKSAYIHLMNINADTSVSADGADKSRDRHERCRAEVQATKAAYEQHLKEITQYNNVYMENMAFVFEKCQQMELKRMKFAIEMLNGVQKVLVDLAHSNKITQVHRTLESNIASVNEPKLKGDLKDWSRLHGTEVPTCWPTFEEYTPEMRNIHGGKPVKKENSGVVLTRQIITSDELPATPVGARSRPMSTVSSVNTAQSLPALNRAGSYESSQEGSNGHSRATTSKPTSINGDTKDVRPSTASALGRHIQSPFADAFPMPTPRKSNPEQESKLSANKENDKSKIINAASVNGKPTGSISSDERYDDDFGIRGPAKVLYDYSPIEDDEIPLRKGEILEVISGPDQLGWCYGKKDGDHLGLFPASYVAPV